MKQLQGGQDEVGGTPNLSKPPASRPSAPRLRPESVRPTVQVKLRLEADDALALQIAAAANKRTISAHVARLVATAGDPVASQRPADVVADASEIAAAIQRLPRDVRRLQGELSRQGGLVKSLFSRAETIRDAEAHSHECSAALAALLDASARAAAAAAAIEAQLVDVRADLRSGVRKLLGRGA